MLGMLGALPLLPRSLARAPQGAGAAIPVERILGFGIRVSDVSRTLDFYQGLFGMPVQARRGETRYLRIGAGPQFVAVSAVSAGETPSISHICLSSPGFDADRLIGSLERIGFTRTDGPAGAEAMRCWVSNPGNGSPEVWFTDARGLLVQLQDPSYCGGSGALGNVCTALEPAPAPGRIALADLSHFTIGTDGQFFQDAMGFRPQAYQATTPALGVGDGIQFLMFLGGGGGRGGPGRGGPGRGGAPAAPAGVDHASFNMEGFDTDELARTLDDYGLSEGTRNAPLSHYISLRMPNRGGAEGGTPEFYFTDPDGLLMQIQDVTYCGGGGLLGEICEVE